MKIKQTIYKRPYTTCDFCEREAKHRLSSVNRVFDWYLCNQHLKDFKETVSKLKES